MSWQNILISRDYDLNDACNKLISSCLSLLHKGKLKEFNDILKETVKHNNEALEDIAKQARKARKPRKAKAARKTKKK